MKGIHQLQDSLHSSFHMKDLGTLGYFLVLEVHQPTKGIFVNQSKYAKDLIILASLENSTLVSLPLRLMLNIRKMKELYSPILQLIDS